MLDPAVLRRVNRHADLVAVAIYDDPIPHFSAVGVELPPERARVLVRSLWLLLLLLRLLMKSARATDSSPTS